MRKFLVVFYIFILQACATNQSEAWDDKYYIENLDENPGHHNLACTNDEAKEIAKNAIKLEYPDHYNKFISNGFSLYSPSYGDYKEHKMIQLYTYKSILGYKEIEHYAGVDSFSGGGSYYEESLEVFLSKECKVYGVDYFKGKVEYTN